MQTDKAASAQSPSAAELQAQLDRAMAAINPQDAYGDYDEATRYHSAVMEAGRLQSLVAQAWRAAA